MPDHLVTNHPRRKFECPYMDSPSFASKLYLADMVRLHTYIRPLKLAYIH